MLDAATKRRIDTARDILVGKVPDSERLGDAFEYLLSVLGSQGDAGQFRTPRHIIDFIVAIIDPKKDETVLDPACGTAGFLISSYKHILKSNSDEQGQATLTPDEKGRLAVNFKGYDLSPDMVRLSLVNLYLHGFADPHIFEYDTLTSEDRWNEYADVILANPPFMSPKGGIRPHNRFSVQSKRSEVLFVDYMAEHLTPSGRAGIIVPEGIIFQSQNAHKQLRKMLVENYLVAVISLPAGVFQPYSGVKTSILILDKVLVKKTDRIGFFKVENDGFDLGAQRRPIDKNDLPRVQASSLEFLGRLRAAESVVNFRSVPSLIVEKGRIALDAEFNLNVEKYRPSISRVSSYEMVPIGEICDLINGRAFKPEDWKDSSSGGLPIVRIQNLNAPGSGFNYYTGEVRHRHVIDKGQLLFSWSGSRGTSFGAHIWKGGKAVLNQHIFKVGFDKARASKVYLFHALNKAVGRVEENLHGGVGLVHITKGNLERIEIPLPPLEVQQEIVAEIEGYQIVIDGALTVIDNYRPHIPVDPSWPVVKLGEACELIMDGTHFSPKSTETGDCLYITSKNVRENYLDLSNVRYVSKEDHQAIYSRCSVQKGDVLYVKDGANTGLAAINTLDEEFSLLSSVAVLRGKCGYLDNRFLCFFLNSTDGRSRMLSMMSGVAIRRLTLQKINQAGIPLLPFQDQKDIVAAIEAEQALVEANRKLIERLEKKIQAAIDRVWGTDKVKGS